MSYNRTPNTVLAGRGLKQSPSQNGVVPPGVVTVTVDADIATTSSLGLVQIGNNINIDANGVISTSSTTDLIPVVLVDSNYSVLTTDYYVGATKKNITITLPLGVVGKVYYIKNQANGSITVQGTSGQTLDSSAFKSLGSESAIICVFDGTRWNII
jgi:hypothetical protein